MRPGKVEHEIRCPRCGKTAITKVKKDEHKKYFQCSKYTQKFELSFNLPTREELEEIFLNSEVPSSLSGPATRVYGAIKDNFPFRLPRLRRGTARSERPIFKGKK